MANVEPGLDVLCSFELEEGSDESSDNSRLCLIGKILASKSLNRLAVTRIILGARKMRAEVSISVWSDNVFMFKLDNEDDRSLVLKNSPWSIMGNLLVIQPLEIGKAISEMGFTHCPFWGQVHGLPMEKMTCRNGQIIAGNIGKLIRVEAPNEGLSLSRSFLRIRVEMDVSLPLPKATFVWRTRLDGIVSKKMISEEIVNAGIVSERIK